MTLSLVLATTILAKMTPRERVLSAISHRQPDRVPVDFWASPETIAMVQKELGLADEEAVLRRFGVDLRYFNGPALKAGKEFSPEPGVVVDHWGVRREARTVSGVRRDGTKFTWAYKHLQASPLSNATSVAEIDKHQWPTADLWDYSKVRSACHALRAGGHAVVAGAGAGGARARLPVGAGPLVESWQYLPRRWVRPGMLSPHDR